MKLTKAAIDRISYDPAKGKKHVEWDDELKGFGLRLWPTGRKVFVVSYRTKQRRQRLQTLGPYGVLTPQAAREEAVRILADTYRGRDPLAERQRVAQGRTVADLCAIYLERHASKKVSCKRMRELLDHFVIPAWGTRKASDVTAQDVATLHDRIGRKGYPLRVRDKQGKGELTLVQQPPAPVQANRVLTLIRSVWNKGRLEYGFTLEDGRTPIPNPTEGIARFPEEERTRFLTEAEMELFAAEIAKEPIYMQGLIVFRLLTGLRPGAARTLRWDEHVDLEAKQLVFEKTKGGLIIGKKRVFVLPLSPEAVTLLERIPRLDGNPYVFCGSEPGRPIVNYRDAWIRLRKRVGIEDVRPHDLRRTLGSWMAQRGVSLPQIGAVLDQSSNATKVYARFHTDPVRKLLTSHASDLVDVIGKTIPLLKAKEPTEAPTA